MLRGQGIILKDFFSKAAKALSVYLDPYGESELKRMDLADKKQDLENNKLNKFNDSASQLLKDNMIFNHEISHAVDPGSFGGKLQNTPKSFQIPKPIANIGILPPDDVTPVVTVPKITPAQRAAQVATVMADGVQGKVKAPLTARFRKRERAI